MTLIYFTNTKKKKSIKANYISRELVLDFKGENLEKKTLTKKNAKRYNKCDTCTNWIVENDNDTIFYNLNVKYIKIPPTLASKATGIGFKKDSILIESIVWKDSNTTINYNICDLKFVSWNRINYFTFTPDFRYEHSNLKYACKKYLGYYIIKNEASLIRYSSVIINDASLKLHEISFQIPLSVYSSKKTITIPEYCVEIDSKKIMIPKFNRPKHFRIAMMEILHKDKNLVDRIKNKEFEYKDIEEIIAIYNRRIE